LNWFLRELLINFQFTFATEAIAEDWFSQVKMVGNSSKPSQQNPLSTSDHTGSLMDNEWQDFMKKATSEIYPKETKIIREGDTARGLFQVVKGAGNFFVTAIF
jgi:hypothetical protein